MTQLDSDPTFQQEFLFAKTYFEVVREIIFLFVISNGEMYL